MIIMSLESSVVSVSSVETTSCGSVISRVSLKCDVSEAGEGRGGGVTEG